MTVAFRTLPMKPPPLPLSDLAWVAGIFDMKALVIKKNNKQRSTPQLVLVVETKQYQVVRGLAALTGTSPELQEEKSAAEWMRRGCVEHCPEKHIHANENGYEWKLPAVARWTITGAAAGVILYNVLPYMRNQRDIPEALEAMMAYTKLEGQGFGATRAALLRLRNLGWVLPPIFEEAL